MSSILAENGGSESNLRGKSYPQAAVPENARIMRKKTPFLIDKAMIRL
jgi:hypothetical protein